MTDQITGLEPPMTGLCNLCGMPRTETLACQCGPIGKSSGGCCAGGVSHREEMSRREQAWLEAGAKADAIAVGGGPGLMPAEWMLKNRNAPMADTIMPVDPTVGVVRIQLSVDGSIMIHDQPVMEAWCKFHGKEISIVLKEGSSWSSEPPTETGIYWYRADDGTRYGHNETVRIRRDADGHLVGWVFGRDVCYMLSVMKGEWSGPLEPPA